MHKKVHQLDPRKKGRREVVGGVGLPSYVLPYYYLWYGGSNFMAPYGNPEGSNQTAQNGFGEDNDGTGTNTGDAAAGGSASDAGGSGAM
jgi:hypothetical protein